MFTRRQFLKKLGIFGSILAISKNISFAAYTNFIKNKSCIIENNEKNLFLETQPFYGINQSGILTPQQSNIILISFNVLANNKKDLKRLFILLTKRIIFLTKQRKINHLINIKMPPKDSGILGEILYPYNLTITVSIGNSLFNNRFGIKHLKPINLIKMSSFSNDALDENLCHGDLLLQICANNNDTVIHALRDIIKYTPDLLSIKWCQEGFISNNAAFSNGKITPINLLGFKDGSANPDVTNTDLMNKFVWINSMQKKEPIWSYGGSYQVIRIIKFRIEFWDRTPLNEQQKIFGRFKYNGAPLGMLYEHDIPDYFKNMNNDIPFDSHMRLANSKQENNKIILRRGYNYARGINKSGQLNMGLLFICYQNDLKKGFIEIQNKLNNEPLEEYIKPVGGGYFFVLPGVTKRKNYLAQKLIESI